MSSKSKESNSKDLLKSTMNKLKGKKNYLILGLVVILILVSTITFIAIKTNKLTPLELKAVSVLNDYKSKLKNPSSLQVFEIRYKESYNTNNELIYNFYIDCAGQNGFGGNTRSIVYYTINNNDDLSYLGDDDKADSTITKYTSESDKLEITMARLIQKEWQDLEDLKENNLNVKKIIKKVEWYFEKENNYYMC